jgi:hypothetical protein
MEVSSPSMRIGSAPQLEIVYTNHSPTSRLWHVPAVIHVSQCPQKNVLRITTY